MQSIPDWSHIRFVVFDVDGTLYAQRPIRLKMAAELALHSARKFSFSDAAILSAYRRYREEMADQAVENFEAVLLEKSAISCKASVSRVRSVVEEWIERRPLRHLDSCTYPHIGELFARIRASGRKIGVLSDYPARAKLEAMALEADHIVHAGEVGALKPDPRGLQHLMDKAGFLPNETVMIGDRFERDGEAAIRANVIPLIRSGKGLKGCMTFARYDGTLFQNLGHSPSLPNSNLQAA